MDLHADTKPDVETIDELAHYVRLGRDDFRAEAAHGTYSAEDLAEAERRWRKVEHLLLSLEVEARAFPTSARGYVLCHRIARRGVDAGMADPEQFPPPSGRGDGGAVLPGPTALRAAARDPDVLRHPLRSRAAEGGIPTRFPLNPKTRISTIRGATRSVAPMRKDRP